MIEPTNGLTPPNEAAKHDERVAATIRTAVDEGRIHNDPADMHGVSMPEYIRRALADAGPLVRALEQVTPLIEVRVRRDGTEEAAPLCHWPVQELDALLPLIRQWGGIYCEGKYFETGLTGQFVLEGEAAYFEVLIMDEEE